MPSQEIKLSPALEYKLNSMGRGKEYNKTIVNTCTWPMNTISIEEDSNCFLCYCSGFLPIPVGKISEFQSIEDVMSSPVAKILHNDIQEKKYTWCAVEQCNIINHNNGPDNFFSLNIGIDNSCNLACPSCRREQIMIDSGPTYKQRVNDVYRVMEWLSRFDKPIAISFGGTGDPLASAIIRPLILTYVPKENQRFEIGTNGLLLKKVMPESTIARAVISYKISVDAGSADVYHQVRRPGKWKNLIENLQWLKDNRQNGQRINLSFLVQQTNYQDIENFVKLCKEFGFNGTLDQLTDWGTWNPTLVETPDEYTVANGTFLDHDVANPSHPEHSDFLKAIQNFSQLNQNCVKLAPYFNKFLQ